MATGSTRRRRPTAESSTDTAPFHEQDIRAFVERARMFVDRG
jgi:hypothetical protein